MSFVVGILLIGSIIFLSIPVVAYLGLMVLQAKRPHLNVEVKRAVEKPQIYEGDEIGVRIRARNAGKESIATLEIRDELPEELELVSSSTSSIISLKPGESGEFFYTVRARTYGVPRLGPIKLRSMDEQGFFENVSMLENFSTVVIFPHTSEKLQHMKIRPRKIKSWPGEIVARRIGQGMEYYSLRQYLPGDSFKTVNWRASARAPSPSQLFVNEYMAELGTDTMIIVDGRAIADVGKKPNSAISYSIHAAMAISDRLIRDRNRVGLITLGSKGERIHPGYGKRQHNRMVLSMLRIRGGETWTIENLSGYLRFYYPGLALIVFVSTLADESAFTAAAEIARLGYDLIVVSPNPLDFGLKDEMTKRIFGSGQKIWEIAKDLSEINRAASIEQLRRADVLVVDWHVADSLGAALEANLRAWNRKKGLLRVPGT